MTKAFVIVLSVAWALLVGLGIASFYSEPKSPEYPKELNYVDGGPSKYTVEQKAIDEKYTADQKSFDEKEKLYSRNVSIVALAFGLVLFSLCFVFVTSIPFLSASLQVGGFLTIAYGVIRGFVSANPKIEFVSILVVVIFLVVSGIYKFNKTTLKEAKN